MTGLLCRWALMALAITAVAAACIAGLYATGAVARGINTIVLPSDAISAKDSKLAHVVPSCTHAVAEKEFYAGLTYTLDDGRTPRLIKYFYAEPDVTKLSIGQHVLEFHGVPYGAHAFETFSAILDVAPAGGNIFLIDAALVQPKDTANVAAITDIIKIAARNDDRAVFVCAARREDNRDCRQLLYDIFGPHPVVMPFEWAKRKETVVAAILTNIPVPGRLVLLTNTPELAAEAEKHGIKTHVVGPAEKFQTNSGCVTVHVSLGALRDFLACRDEWHGSASQPATAKTGQ